MKTKLQEIIILMPDDSHIEVSYYCNDKKITDEDKDKFTNLYIQLHDCICTIKIEKSLSNKWNELETLVHNKVINTKGHLC